MVPNIILEEEDSFNQWTDNYDQWNNTSSTPVEEDKMESSHIFNVDNSVLNITNTKQNEKSKIIIVSELQQHLIHTNKDMKNYPFIYTDVSIPIVAWKLTKNRSHIISDVSIPGGLSHSGNSQRFKLDAESPSMSEKDIELLYCLIENYCLQAKLLYQTYKHVLHTYAQGWNYQQTITTADI